MNTALKLLILTFIFHSTKAYLPTDEYGPRLTDIFKKLNDICTDKSGVSGDRLMEARDGNFVDDSGLKSYLYCLLDVSGLVDSNFELSKVVLHFLLPEALVGDESFENGVSKCVDEGAKIDSSENTDKAFASMKCIYKLNPEDFFLIWIDDDE